LWLSAGFDGGCGVLAMGAVPQSTSLSPREWFYLSLSSVAKAC
jgi:hypothetical protein